MRFFLSRAAFLGCSVVLAFCCSCEEHHPGELPEVQRDRLAGPEHGAGKKADAPVKPTVTPTPTNFFPEQSPH